MEAGVALSLSQRICSLRRQVCPRTSYTTAGAATSELIVAMSAIPAHERRNIDLFRDNILKLNEFTCVKEVNCVAELSRAIQGHVAIYFAPFSVSTTNTESEINEYIIEFKRLLCEKKSNLVALIVPLGCYRDVMSDDMVDNSAAKYSVITENHSNMYKLLIAYCKPESVPLSCCNMKGNNGQPSVKSREQFKFLWDSALDGKDTVDFGKQRVLQRLSDKPVYSNIKSSVEKKLSISEWDEIVGRMIYQRKLDDFGIYSHLRKLYVGTSLAEDLEITNNASVTASSSRNDDDEGGGEERASYLVSLTVNCIPSKYRSHIKSILDYGCAEGAITGQLCKQLQVVATNAYGADVRYLPAVGFQFIQLPAETETPGYAGGILPSIRDHSIDFINSAMVFHHVRHVSAALTELRRVISDQGIFVVREHHCSTPYMAAFLDITHGLYSLCWKVPVEWPSFLDEYEAWYRGIAEWNQCITDAGFRRLTEVEMTEDGIRQYNAAQISVPKTNNKGTGLGRIPNAIKAYYAVYVPEKKRNAVSISDEAMINKKSRLQQQPLAAAEEMVAYESKSYRKKYYITDKGTNKPRWIQLLPDTQYPSGYYYIDGQRSIGIHEVVFVKD